MEWNTGDPNTAYTAYTYSIGAIEMLGVGELYIVLWKAQADFKSLWDSFLMDFDFIFHLLQN